MCMMFDNVPAKQMVSVQAARKFFSKAKTTRVARAVAQKDERIKSADCLLSNVLKTDPKQKQAVKELELA